MRGFINLLGEPSRSQYRPRNPTIAGDRPPRYGKKRHTLTVGRGPVPRQRPRAPGPVSQDRLKLWHLPSDLDPFVIRRAQTTAGGNTHRDDGDRGGQAPALRKERHPFIRGAPALREEIKTRMSLLPSSYLLPDEHLPRGGELARGQRIEIDATGDRLTERVFAIPIRRTTPRIITTGCLITQV